MQLPYDLLVIVFKICVEQENSIVLFSRLLFTCKSVCQIIKSGKVSNDIEKTLLAKKFGNEYPVYFLTKESAKLLLSNLLKNKSNTVKFHFEDSLRLEFTESQIINDSERITTKIIGFSDSMICKPKDYDSDEIFKQGSFYFNPNYQGEYVRQMNMDQKTSPIVISFICGKFVMYQVNTKNMISLRRI